ncbi:uncharacterized protein V6R79_002458 [Siganus canaliculatus]
MPPLKSSAAFHEQRRNLERARTEDYLKRKIKSRPERSELIRMHILEETSAEASLQAKQLQLKRSRLADDLNDKISHRPGPMELIHKNILPVHSSIKQVFIETQFPKAASRNSSCDEDSNYSQSPDQSLDQDSPLGLLPLASPPETLTESTPTSSAQAPPPLPLLPQISGSAPSLKLTNGTETPSAQRICAVSQVKCQPKPNADRSSQRHKKPKDNKPKIKKLKYHQYIPPDQKGDKEPSPHLDSSYAKILQQQQLFLQLQILNQQQQQQHSSYHTILPASPSKAQSDQQLSPPSSMTSSSSPPQPAAAPSDQGSAPSAGETKSVSLPPKLDEMKVAELKSELKLHSLPVSGTKSDLIERLRNYQELNRASDTTSCPTVGGTTRPGAERVEQSSKSSNINTSLKQQQQFQLHPARSSLPAQTGSSVTTTPQQPAACGGILTQTSVSLTPAEGLQSAGSQEQVSIKSNRLTKMMSSPSTQLSLQQRSTAQLSLNIKKEPKCSTPEPCPFSLKAAPQQRHCVASSLSSVDKDKMLQEKDKQIEELTRMLRQKQKLVEVLKMQLERRKNGGRLPEPLVLVRVKQEPPDKFSPVPPPPCEMDLTKETIKQEAAEAEEGVSETTALPQDTQGISLGQTQEVQIKQEQMSKTQPHVCLQNTTLHFAQQPAIQKLLLQKQHNVQNQQRTLPNPNQRQDDRQHLRKLSQDRKRKSQKQQTNGQETNEQHQKSKDRQRPTQVKQQKSGLLRQNSQQTKQLQQEHQQPLQVSQTYLNQPLDSASSLPLGLLKSNSTSTLVTDSNGNHFLIALTNHNITDNQNTDVSESKGRDPITLQRVKSTPTQLPEHIPVQVSVADNQVVQNVQAGFLKPQNTKNGGLQVSTDRALQGAAQCLSAPASLHPFFKDQESAASQRNTSSPLSQNEFCPGLDVLFSPLSPASFTTAVSSPDKDTEHEDDFTDIILQTGEMPKYSFTPEPDPSLDHLNPPSPFQFLLSPSIPPGCDTLGSTSMVQPELQTVADIAEEKQPLRAAGDGRLEDFLESTIGRPLLGVEPGGPVTLIDDLHSQMLCTPSILDHPPSPMDTCDMERGLDNMDWLDQTVGGVSDEETPTLAPLGHQTPPSIFSMDFLDSIDLPIPWDSSL